MKNLKHFEIMSEYYYNTHGKLGKKFITQKNDID